MFHIFFSRLNHVLASSRQIYSSESMLLRILEQILLPRVIPTWNGTTSESTSAHHIDMTPHEDKAYRHHRTSSMIIKARGPDKMQVYINDISSDDCLVDQTLKAVEQPVQSVLSKQCSPPSLTGSGTMSHWQTYLKRSVKYFTLQLNITVSHENGLYATIEYTVTLKN